MGHRLNTASRLADWPDSRRLLRPKRLHMNEQQTSIDSSTQRDKEREARQPLPSCQTRRVNIRHVHVRSFPSICVTTTPPRLGRCPSKPSWKRVCVHLVRRHIQQTSRTPSTNCQQHLDMRRNLTTRENETSEFNDLQARHQGPNSHLGTQSAVGSRRNCHLCLGYGPLRVPSTPQSHAQQAGIRSVNQSGHCPDMIDAVVQMRPIFRQMHT